MAVDLIKGSSQEKQNRAKKMMLWFGIVSLIMAFAGWTSAYIVSSKRKDWLNTIELPQAFFISTVIIILSSVTYYLGKKAVKKGNQKSTSIWLLTTLILGITFVILQFHGFSQMLKTGYYFTGPTSNIKMSYIFLIAFVHILHVVAGLISLLIVFYRQLKRKYSPENFIGFELGATFWHFLDILWIYLVLFMFFVK